MTTLNINSPMLDKALAHRGLLFPVALVGLLLVFLVPLPTVILDLLLIVNLTISVVLLVSVVYAKSPLELSVFPSFLLAVTLFRLVLNVATTRLILTAGEGNPQPDEALGAAGSVIETFSQFVTAGSLTVGVIIFVIIFVIQFIVITKGATRISEVAARFTLDAMPGKQMAIDADLNAGALDENTARQRREEIGREADFYGAMDGSSKFVRGDAIAGIVITLINIVGGIYVGMVEYGWDLSETAALFTRLTIGDGLVSQVPAFIVSLAAGLLVTRSSSRDELGNEVISQIFAKPKALFVASGFLAVMSVTGLPTLPLLLLATVCGGMAWVLNKSNSERVEQERVAERAEADARQSEPQPVEQLLDVDAMELEIGGGLLPLCREVGGGLVERVGGIRRQVAMELGVVVPPLRIRDNLQLDANDYVVKVRGEAVARGETFPGQLLAMDNGATAGPIAAAEQTTEPAFGLPAYWIGEAQREDAELLNYTVVDAAVVLATHLTEVIKRHAHELLTRQEVSNLLDVLKQKSPALVEEVIGAAPEQIKSGELQKILQNLLRERVPVRDLETIVETLGDFAGRTKDIDVLTEFCRHALARTICKQQVDENDKLWCVTLDPAMEDLIGGHTKRSDDGAAQLTMPPQTQQQVVDCIGVKVEELAQMGHPAVVLCNPAVRQQVRRLIETTMPHVAVLSYNEVVKEVDVEATGLVTMHG